MDPHALLLARAQFAFTISFHIVFPAFSIGSSAFVATLLVLWRRTGHSHYHRLARFWTKIFAVSFAMGVVSGIPLSYEFGTNWSRFSLATGNVIGPLIGYEVLTAFFLESTFLGIMLFGWKRVPPWLHVTSAVLVALGTCISGFWIIAANSWMQTPAGHIVRDGIAYPVDWFHVIFNPSFPYRFVHMMTAAYLTTSVVVLAAGARYLLEGKFEAEARTMLRMGIGMVAILGPAQLFFGDQHGLNTLEYQPVKVAAMEGHWENDGPAPLILFAVPDSAHERNRAEIAIPHLGGLILKHDFNGRYAGLKDFPANRRPPVVPVFFAFRIMVGIGLFLIALGLTGAWLWKRQKLFTARWYLRVATYTWPLGFLAILAGWVTTETGRQPYVAYGILRTDQALSPVSAATVAGSLVAFVLAYTIVFSIGVYYIRRLVLGGPQDAAVEPGHLPQGLPNRPLSLGTQAGEPGPADTGQPRT
ncbi:MAG TPA: cytochrome ubiquinol oxidase subunit I [Steroidobacteraceae bacterium]